MAVQIQIRRGTASAWTSANPTLAAGEAAKQSSLDGGGTAEEAQTAYDTAYAATD